MPTYKKFLSAAVCAVIFCYPFFSSANDDGGASSGVTVEQVEKVPAHPEIFTLIGSGNAGSVRLENRDELRQFYGENNGEFIWVSNGRFSTKAMDVFKIIQSSYEHGLNPEVYNRITLASMMEENFPDDQSSAVAELVMTDAVVHYGRDISGMRLTPKLMGADGTSWSRGITASSLLGLMAKSKDPKNVLEALAPRDDVYKGLQAELKRILAQYSEESKDGKSKISLSRLLRPNERHRAVVALREKLGKTTSQNADLYDEDLKAAVIEFQKARGLMPDGVIGPRTVIALNEGLRDRLVKVLANLERRRWIKGPMPSRYVEVNIPAFWLRAVENNNPVFEMPVVIGRKKRQTMSFVDEIIGIRFNPSWYVPDTIKKEDYLPELQKNPQALAEKGIAFRVWAEDGSGLVTVASEDIDWANMSEDGLKSVQMVQGPGARNALGRIRVLMPNRYDIYLHDTNMPSLFKKDDRAQSSGCVRMSEPRRMANFVLGRNEGWSEDRLDYYLRKQKTLEIRADEPIPVYIFYFTVWQGEGGKLIFGNDLYGLDEALVRVLKSNGQVNFPLI